MTQRYLGWRAGALAVVGCALGALLASPSAQAQTCVGDCNEDGQVLINELIIGVNIALDSSADHVLRVVRRSTTMARWPSTS